MKRRKLGPFGVAEIGLGCMNLSHAYGTPPSPEQGRALLQKALDLGIDHFDTASLYGFGGNEELVGAFLKPVRRRVTLASKCGLTGIDGKRVVDGRPASLKRDCENSLKRLRTEVIDLYYLHRWDKAVPIEDSVGALAELVAEGKIRAIGLSEVSGMPRFLPPHFERNKALLPGFRALAAEWGIRPAALAIAWLLHQAEDVLPIPGTTSAAHLEEDVSASGVSLGAAQLAALDALINDRTVSGPRYNEAAQAAVDTEERP